MSKEVSCFDISFDVCDVSFQKFTIFSKKKCISTRERDESSRLTIHIAARRSKSEYISCGAVCCSVLQRVAVLQ